MIDKKDLVELGFSNQYDPSIYFKNLIVDENADDDTNCYITFDYRTAKIWYTLQVDGFDVKSIRLDDGINKAMLTAVLSILNVKQ